jgi:ankyrin repeat protein
MKNISGKLLDACCNGDKEKVIELIAQGVNVNAKNDYSWTPLHWACSYDHKEIVLTLLGAGANVNKKTLTGLTPLHYACYYGRKEIALIFVEASANLFVKDINDETPLDNAYNQNHKDIIGAIYLYYLNKDNKEIANQIKEKYDLKMKDILQ